MLRSLVYIVDARSALVRDYAQDQTGMHEDRLPSLGLGFPVAAPMNRTAATEAFWRSFREATSGQVDHYDVVAFGDSAEMADELGGLAVSGRKRATAGLLRDFIEGGEAMPRVGGHVVLVDGRGTPLCVWRTTEVAVKPLIEGDETFAWDEGEGDRSLEYWLEEHRRYFRRQALREGFSFHDGIDTVFERFTVIWPDAFADPTGA